jgi:hypothetical protein
MPSLRGPMVLGLLDGTDAAPPPTIEAKDSDKKKVIIPNPSYAAWLSHDQHVLNYIVNSLSPGILAHVLEKETTFQVWSTIASMFSSMSHSKVSHLQTALNNTKMKEKTAAQYFTIIKGFCSELATAGNIFEDYELVGYILNGLEKMYNDLVDRVSSNPNISLDVLLGQLSSYDMR